MRVRAAMMIALIGVLLWTGGLVASVPPAAAAPPPQGVVVSWGANASGQLGDGVACGVLCPSPVFLAAPSGITAVSAGYYHSLALAGDGTVWAWGRNASGELGDGQACGSSCTRPVHLAAPIGITAIAAGDYFSLALASDGTVWAWGDNNYGQLGDGQACGTTICATPVHLAAPTGIAAIAAGYRHSLALAGDGTVWAWGLNDSGSLGDGQACGTAVCATPVHLAAPSGFTGITAISAGAFHSLALKDDGTVWAWGGNNGGALGDGYACGTSCTRPTHLFEPTGITAIAAGDYHSLALANDGTVWSWGSNGLGEMGDGQACGNPYCATPVHLAAPTGVTAIAAGDKHSQALASDGTVWAWGDNSSGQLGDGQACGTTFCARPVHLTIPTRTIATAAGGFHSLALVTPRVAAVTVASPLTAPYGTASVTLSATVAVAGAAATDGTVPGTVAAGNASASFPLNGVGAGTYRIAARYQAQTGGTTGTAATPGTLTITKVPLTVRVQDASRPFGEITPLPCMWPGGASSGLVNGDDPDDLGGTLVCTTVAAASTTTGRFALTPSGLSSDNYTIRYGGALLAITPRKVDPTLTSNPGATPESPATRGQAITLAVTVPLTPSGVAPRGTVQFWVNGRSVASVAVGNGRAEYRFTPTAAGTYSVEARFSSTDMRFVAGPAALGTLTVR